MKRILITILVFLRWSASIIARSPQEAAEIARQFISQRTSAIGTAQRASASNDVDLAFTQYSIDRTTPAVFVFNSVAQKVANKAVAAHVARGDADSSWLSEKLECAGASTASRNILWSSSSLLYSDTTADV